MKKDIKNWILWGVIALLAIAVIYVVFFNGSAGSSTLSAGQTAGQAASSYGGMVGGC